MHQLGVVEHLLGVEHVEVLVEELPDGLPLRSLGRLAGRHDVVGIHAQLPRLGQHGADLTGERPGAEGGAPDCPASRPVPVSRLPSSISRSRNSCSGAVSSRSAARRPGRRTRLNRRTRA